MKSSESSKMSKGNHMLAAVRVSIKGIVNILINPEKFRSTHGLTNCELIAYGVLPFSEQILLVLKSPDIESLLAYRRCMEEKIEFTEVMINNTSSLLPEINLTYESADR